MSESRISDEAVEAAARAFIDVDPLWPDGAWEDMAEESRENARGIVGAVLEAAVPHLMAELAEPGSAMREAMSIAWEQGREDGYHHRTNPYRSEEDD